MTSKEEAETPHRKSDRTAHVEPLLSPTRERVGKGAPLRFVRNADLMNENPHRHRSAGQAHARCQAAARQLAAKRRPSSVSQRRGRGKRGSAVRFVRSNRRTMRRVESHEKAMSVSNELAVTRKLARPGASTIAREVAMPLTKLSDPPTSQKAIRTTRQSDLSRELPVIYQGNVVGLEYIGKKPSRTVRERRCGQAAFFNG